VYSVADLVIPIDDYVTPSHMNLQRAMERIDEQQRINLNGGGNTPFANTKFSLQNGQPVGSGSGTNLMSTAAGQPSMSTGAQPGNLGSPMTHNANVSPTKQTMQDMLIKLVTNTVAPQSWAEVGGAGTIDYMPIGLALVVNQTPDVQEQVADLLDALRRLQDLEVAVEVRIITLAETFFERIGLDFNLNIKTDHITSQYEPQITTGQFKPAGQVNDFSPTRFVSGLSPASNGSPGTFTSDLDIPIRNSSFQYAIPPFAYPNNPGFNGGLSMGLAFLSDIQVYMFMEAAQGDRRTNVMAAPKLTLFNGQTSTITITDQQFFVSNVNVVGFGGQIVFVPVNNPVPLGVSLAIQAVVSADRRFVRLNLNPQLSNLASAIVPLFPVTTFITVRGRGPGPADPVHPVYPAAAGVLGQHPDDREHPGRRHRDPGRPEDAVRGPQRVRAAGAVETAVREPAVPQRRLRPRGPEPAADGDAADHHQLRGGGAADGRVLHNGPPAVTG
jgi:type II secretory pathway component GspD/PulD (secretin)